VGLRGGKSGWASGASLYGGTKVKRDGNEESEGGRESPTVCAQQMQYKRAKADRKALQ